MRTHFPLLLCLRPRSHPFHRWLIRARISLLQAAVFRSTRPCHHQIHSITRAYSINYFHFASMAFPFQWSSSPSPPRVDAVSTPAIPFQWNSPLPVHHWITFRIVSEIQRRLSIGRRRLTYLLRITYFLFFLPFHFFFYFFFIHLFFWFRGKISFLVALLYFFFFFFFLI